MSNTEYKLNKYLSKTKMLLNNEFIDNNKLLFYLQHLDYYVQKGGYDERLLTNINNIISSINGIVNRSNCNNEEKVKEINKKLEELQQKKIDIEIFKNDIPNTEDKILDFVKKYISSDEEELKYYKIDCSRLTESDKECIKNSIGPIKEFFNNLENEIKKLQNKEIIQEVNKTIDKKDTGLLKLKDCFENMKNNYKKHQEKLKELDKFISKKIKEYQPQQGGSTDDIIKEIINITEEIKNKIKECKQKSTKIYELETELRKYMKEINTSKLYIDKVLVKNCNFTVNYVDVIKNIENMLSSFLFVKGFNLEDEDSKNEFINLSKNLIEKWNDFIKDLPNKLSIESEIKNIFEQ